MNTQKNVNERLAKLYTQQAEKKQELSAEKIELSVVSDIRQSIDEASAESQGLENILRRMKEHNDSIKVWEKTADKLEAEADNLRKQAARAQMNIGNALEAADKSARDLEIEPAKIKGYKDAEKKYDQLEKQMAEVNSFKWAM
jgi:chromosome segregation ATPase